MGLIEVERLRQAQGHNYDVNFEGSGDNFEHPIDDNENGSSPQRAPIEIDSNGC